MGNSKVNLLEKKEFDMFYSQIVNIALDAKVNPGKDNVTIERLLKETNLVFDVEPNLKDAVRPALSSNLYAPDQEAINGCAACSICAVCAICGAINGAAGVMGLAGIIGFVSSQINVLQ